MRRSLLIGATAGVIVVVLVVIAAVGVRARREQPADPTSGAPIVVIGTAPSSGVRERLAVAAVVVPDPDGRFRVTVVDPHALATVPGTSARTLREAFDFGGGQAVAEAVKQATGIAEPAVLVLSAARWIPLIRSSRATVDVGQTVDAYLKGKLIEIPGGRAQVLSEEQLGVLADAAESMPAKARSETDRSFSTAFGSAIAEHPAVLQEARSSDSTRPSWWPF